MKKGFETYLQQQELSPNKEEREVLYRHYRKLYMREYQQNRKEKISRVELVFSKADYLDFKRQAHTYGLPLVTYLKKVLSSHHNHTVLHPHLNEFRAIEIAINRIGTNINQISYLAHRKGYETHEYMKLQSRLEDLTKVITTKLNAKITLEQFIQKEISKNPLFIKHLKAALQRVENFKSAIT